MRPPFCCSSWLHCAFFRLCEPVHGGPTWISCLKHRAWARVCAFFCCFACPHICAPFCHCSWNHICRDPPNKTFWAEIMPGNALACVCFSPLDLASNMCFTMHAIRFFSDTCF